MIERIFFDKNFSFAVRFFTEPEDNGPDIYWLNYQVVDVVAFYEKDYTSTFGCYDDGSGIDSKATTFQEAFEKHPICNGFIKWDGCMEMYKFNKHFCGYSTYFQDMLKLIYLGAKEVMGDTFEEDLSNLKNIEE